MHTFYVAEAPRHPIMKVSKGERRILYDLSLLIPSSEDDDTNTCMTESRGCPVCHDCVVSVTVVCNKDHDGMS